METSDQLKELSAAFGLPLEDSAGNLEQWCRVGDEYIEIPVISE